LSGKRRNCLNWQPQRKNNIADQIASLQREIAADLQAKDTASTLRIHNFRMTHVGKMVSETFYCTKEAKKGRHIHRLEHN
jgi:hypothetical protein